MSEPKLAQLEVNDSLWQRVFTIAPLVLVGTREAEGRYDLAPKHLVVPMWGPFFGFVCTPRHGTYRNAVREGSFTVSWPRANQVVVTSLAASPRCEDGSKPSLQALQTFPASRVDGVLVREGYFFLECELERTVDGFGDNSLLVGRVVAASADPDVLRTLDRDDAELVHEQPLLAYLDPGRFATIDRSTAFPLPAGFER